MEKPSIPKGSRDFGPAQMAKRQFIFTVIRSVFQKYGFQPLETPAMENLATLTGKYGEEGDQLLFKVLNSGDYLKDASQEHLNAKNSRAVVSSISEKGLRYDLTVPFARYVVMNRHEITFPFRRYQIQPVWRADRPQKGRYREFYQCDADVVGTRSLLCEAEIILMIREIFSGLGLTQYTIKINHRAVLSALATLCGGRDKESHLFVAIDKLDKIGKEKVTDELIARGFSGDAAALLFSVLDFKGSTVEKLNLLEERFRGDSAGAKGLSDLREILDLVRSYGTTEDHVELDVSLARGLSYYTGCIFEVKIGNVAIGSVSGGGRYDNLTGGFGMPDVSGVGISFGVDRLYDALEELQLFPSAAEVSTRVLLTHTDEASLRYSLSLAHTLRAASISTEVYPDVTKLKKQLEYADKKSIPFAIVVGSEEMQSGVLTLKVLATGAQQKADLSTIIGIVKNN